MLESGEVGLERAVALIRLPRTGASGALMEASRGLDLAGLWRLVASRERLTSEEEAKGFSDRFLVMQPTLVVEVVGWPPRRRRPDSEKALLARAEEFPRLEGEDRSQRMADALTSLALDSLTGGSEESPAGSGSGRSVGRRPTSPRLPGGKPEPDWLPVPT